MKKALRFFLCSCMVAVGSMTLSGCGDSKSEAIAPEEIIPQPQSSETEMTPEKSVTVH